MFYAPTALVFANRHRERDAFVTACLPWCPTFSFLFLVGLQYLGEPAEVAREKERERSAGREALRACGFQAEEQRNVLQRLCRYSYDSLYVLVCCSVVCACFLLGTRRSLSDAGPTCVEASVKSLRVAPRKKTLRTDLAGERQSCLLASLK